MYRTGIQYAWFRGIYCASNWHTVRMVQRHILCIELAYSTHGSEAYIMYRTGIQYAWFRGIYCVSNWHTVRMVQRHILCIELAHSTHGSEAYIVYQTGTQYAWFRGIYCISNWHTVRMVQRHIFCIELTYSTHGSEAYILYRTDIQYAWFRGIYCVLNWHTVRMVQRNMSFSWYENREQLVIVPGNLSNFDSSATPSCICLLFKRLNSCYSWSEAIPEWSVPWNYRLGPVWITYELWTAFKNNKIWLKTRDPLEVVLELIPVK